MKDMGTGNMWVRLGIMTLVSFVAMHFLMYSMVNTFGDIFLSVNQIWMAGSMTAAMVAIELLVMGAMYKEKNLRIGLIVGSILFTVAFVLCTRYQIAVGNTDFIRSMIPHHSGAILMCANPEITDPELKTLCQQISKGQQEEIDHMNAIKKRLSAAASCHERLGGEGEVGLYRRSVGANVRHCAISTTVSENLCRMSFYLIARRPSPSSDRWREVSWSQ